ncbi:EscU/YscU/HrcU family type III secretion system export apparatus switch protein [Undibacterium sp. Ji67W]|uniref:EscU/YscU/HrcU family type III secretion system export apparatus switch protein n=1 Tax=Undibacterium sp. Ji67W TaxID=3413042 RepID=UPI003BF26E30
MVTTNSNVNKNAVAIAYETGASAPKVVAKGKGLIAETIIAKAKECGIHVHESKELVSLLMKVDLDKDIPPTLYRVVAELLAWLYHIDKEKSENNTGTNKPDLPSDFPFEPTNFDEK